MVVRGSSGDRSLVCVAMDRWKVSHKTGVPSFLRVAGSSKERRKVGMRLPARRVEFCCARFLLLFLLFFGARLENKQHQELEL